MNSVKVFEVAEDRKQRDQAGQNLANLIMDVMMRKEAGAGHDDQGPGHEDHGEG